MEGSRVRKKLNVVQLCVFSARARKPSKMHHIHLEMHVHEGKQNRDSKSPPYGRLKLSRNFTRVNVVPVCGKS